MLARVRSGALRGIDALVVDVEVDVSSGLPHTTTVGLPDGAVREGTERIRAALRNCGFKHAERRVTVNLGPAGVRKEGAAFDLPIALGLLAAFGRLGLLGSTFDALGVQVGLTQTAVVLAVAFDHHRSMSVPESARQSSGGEEEGDPEKKNPRRRLPPARV